MNAAQVIEEIQKLPSAQLEEVLMFLNGPEDEEGILNALQRQREIDEGTVQTLSHDEVFTRARNALKCK